MASPSREEITNAYQSALRAPAAPSAGGPQPVTALPPAAPPVARRPGAAAPQQLAATPLRRPPHRPPSPPRHAAGCRTLAGGDAVADRPAHGFGRTRDADESRQGAAPVRRHSAGPPAAGTRRGRAGRLAAFLLAQTYDPDVLGARDARTITPDLVAARAWYQKSSPARLRGRTAAPRPNAVSPRGIYATLSWTGACRHHDGVRLRSSRPDAENDTTRARSARA